MLEQKQLSSLIKRFRSDACVERFTARTALHLHSLLINYASSLLLLKGSGELDRMTAKWFENPEWIKDLK